MNELVSKAIKEQDVRFLCKLFYDIDLYPTEEEIVRCISYRTHQRVHINAYTRYGKSLSTALGVLNLMLFNENLTATVIAPTSDQTNILRNYMSDNMLKCPLFQELIPTKLTELERLQREFSKRRINFKGHRTIQTFSAEGKGDRLMGWGGDIIIEDEACLIDGEVHRQKVARMLLDSPETVYVELANPWHRLNHAWKHFNNPNFHTIHVSWKDGVKEGRHTEEEIKRYITDEELTPIDITILLDSRFPEDTEDTLIRYEWIERAEEKKTKMMPSIQYCHTCQVNFKRADEKDHIGHHISDLYRIVYGLDVAEMGRDLTVLTKLSYFEGVYQHLNTWSWGKKDTFETTNMVEAILEGDKKSPVYVDGTGVGKGVYDNLHHHEFNAVEVKVGRSADKKERFANLKAEMYWHLRKLFEDDRVCLRDLGRVKVELNSIRYEIKNGKVFIIDPEDKSPDFADSFALATIGSTREVITENIDISML